MENHGWYGEGDERTLSFFALYLAGAETVTMATGAKTVPPENPGASPEWDLTCHQARVIGRRGL